MKVLECSSKGDKRFSAFYAKVSVGGKVASIEEHYQLSKRFGEVIPQTIKDAKGKRPTHFHVNGADYPVEQLSMWYKLLWLKYLDKNPDLVEYASGFDDFTDMFRGKAINCQADVIKQYVQEGAASIMEECEPLTNAMKRNKPVFKLVIAGSRGFTDYSLLKDKCDHLLSQKRDTHKIVIISGGADGADRLGERYARERGYKIEQYIPDWNGLGRKAGHVRNREMANASDAVVAFWSGASPGTKGMINYCKKIGKRCVVIQYKEESQ